MRLSDQLESWFAGDEHKTVGDLLDTFGQQSFAVLFVVLMAFPALPLPTGGLSHILELMTMVLALELVLGRREVWVPRRWRARTLRVADRRLGALLLARVRWIEGRSRPRLATVFTTRAADRAFGMVVFVLAVAAFLAPPFSGLDTLPAMGVVGASLGVLLGDAVIAALGVLVGAVGVTVIVGLAHAVRTLLW